MQIRPFWTLLHIGAITGPVVPGQPITTLCGRSKRIPARTVPLPLLACSTCLSGAIESPRAEALSDTMGRLHDIGKATNRLVDLATDMLDTLDRPGPGLDYARSLPTTDTKD